MTNPVKIRVARKLKGTDVGQLQGLMQQQLYVTDSGRFRVDPNGNQVTILDTLTRRKTVVPLFAARSTIEALEALFG